MSITEKLSHAAERKAFETILDSMLKKGQTQDVGDLAQQLIDVIQKIHKGTWSDKSYETLRMVAESGAHSTDLEAPESAEHLCEKCKAYADCWKPEADKLWAAEHGN